MKNLIYNRLVYFSILSLCLTHCAHRNTPKTKQEINSYVNDPMNGLTKTVKAENFTLSATYQPISPVPVNCLACKDYWYFILKITANPTAENQTFLDAHVFPESIETYAFRMGEYVKIVTPHDTVTAADYTFQRTFGLDKQGSFLFVFPKKIPQSADRFTLLVKANGLIHVPLALEFRTQDIEKTRAFPSL